MTNFKSPSDRDGVDNNRKKISVYMSNGTLSEACKLKKSASNSAPFQSPALGKCLAWVKTIKSVLISANVFLGPLPFLTEKTFRKRQISEPRLLLLCKTWKTLRGKKQRKSYQELTKIPTQSNKPISKQAKTTRDRKTRHMYKGDYCFKKQAWKDLRELILHSSSKG